MKHGPAGHELPLADCAWRSDAGRAGAALCSAELQLHSTSRAGASATRAHKLSLSPRFLPLAQGSCHLRSPPCCCWEALPAVRRRCCCAMAPPTAAVPSDSALLRRLTVLRIWL